MIKLITEHKDYLLLVDFSAQTEIPEGGWCFEIHEEYPSENFRFLDPSNSKMAWWFRELNMAYLKEKPKEFGFWKKVDGTCMAIIAHLPLNGSPKLGDLPLLPKPVYAVKAWSYGGSTGVNDYLMSDGSIQAFKPSELPELLKQEEDVEILALEYSNNYSHCNIEEQRYRNRGFVAGYKAASKKWTEGDIEKAFIAGRKYGGLYKDFDEYQAKVLYPTLTPIDFIPDYEEKWENQYTGVGDSRGYQPILKLKIVNNVLQGTYKFK